MTCHCLRDLPPMVVLSEAPTDRLALQCCDCGRLWGPDPNRGPFRGLECKYCGTAHSRERAREGMTCEPSPTTMHLWCEKPVQN